MNNSNNRSGRTSQRASRLRRKSHNPKATIKQMRGYPKSQRKISSKEQKKQISGIDDEYALNLKLLEMALANQKKPPVEEESQRTSQYVPRNPYPTPDCFPSVPAKVFDDPSSFEKFSTDTLFFIFYFQQGTPHQYLAARELKKQCWRYHKSKLTWFQRHDDPKMTDEYEEGNYVYFDYNHGWKKRIKETFKFEYHYLEDELLIPMNSNLATNAPPTPPSPASNQNNEP